MKIISGLIAFTLLLGSVPALASGTYRGGATRSPATIDRAMYNAGKQLFSGKIELASVGSVDPGAQATELEGLQQKLPRAVRTGKDLTTYAGKLDSNQLEELKYFLEVRYKISAD